MPDILDPNQKTTDDNPATPGGNVLPPVGAPPTAGQDIPATPLGDLLRPGADAPKDEPIPVGDTVVTPEVQENESPPVVATPDPVAATPSVSDTSVPTVPPPVVPPPPEPEPVP